MSRFEREDAPTSVGSDDATSSALISIENLCVEIDLGGRKVYALDDVSMSIERGESVGLVGESGSGKSVLARSMMGLYNGAKQISMSGTVEFGGFDMRALTRRELRDLWGEKIGIVLQDPLTSLHPIKRIGKQLTETMRRHDRTLSRSEALDRAEKLLRVVGIPEPRRRLRAYPHELSGGMRQRVMIAIAIANSPDLIIADEPTTALDVTVQAQVLALLEDVRKRANSALLLISHDLGVVATYTDRVFVMYAGQVVETATVTDLFDHPLMPYTASLLRTIPRIDGVTGDDLGSIPGNPPDPSNPGVGCRYNPRCALAQDKCRDEPPPLEYRDDHGYRCWFPLERAAGSASHDSHETDS